jgi:YD repeat-containing protein
VWCGGEGGTVEYQRFAGRGLKKEDLEAEDARRIKFVVAHEIPNPKSPSSGKGLHNWDHSLGRSPLFNIFQDLWDAEGKRTHWDYNFTGRLTKKTYPDGKETNYSYQPLTGWLGTITDALGQVKTHSYLTPRCSVHAASLRSFGYAAIAARAFPDGNL